MTERFTGLAGPRETVICLPEAVGRHRRVEMQPEFRERLQGFEQPRYRVRMAAELEFDQGGVPEQDRLITRDAFPLGVVQGYQALCESFVEFAALDVNP